jgi:hypothetical protein
MNGILQPHRCENLKTLIIDVCSNVEIVHVGLFWTYLSHVKHCYWGLKVDRDETGGIRYVARWQWDNIIMGFEEVDFSG